jgi:hypothetical protein
VAVDRFHGDGLLIEARGAAGFVFSTTATSSIPV